MQVVGSVQPSLFVAVHLECCLCTHVAALDPELAKLFNCRGAGLAGSSLAQQSLLSTLKTYCSADDMPGSTSAVTGLLQD